MCSGTASRRRESGAAWVAASRGATALSAIRGGGPGAPGRHRLGPTRHPTATGTPDAAARPAPGREVDALASVLRTHRDRAMVEAMLLGGLRRCEVLGLRLGDVKVGERRLFIAEGKGGHQRIVPISPRFFATLARYLDSERPADPGTDRVFLVLKGSNRGEPLSSHGIDEIIRGARRRAGIDHLTCHQLRHTCLTRLREAGMALEAVQAQAGHRSIESTRVYLHLSAGWLASEYANALAAIDAQAAAAQAAAPSAGAQ